jgi:hypothetical protein
MFSFRALKSPRYLEWPAHPSRSVIVAGVGRSGTTWLGDVVSRMINARVVFEPCITGRDGNFLIDHGGKINLDERCERPLPLWEQADFEKQKQIIERFMFGCIKGDWIDQDVKAGIYNKRVIKVIRANFFIGHIVRSWPEIKVLYVIRSPHAVVESMLNQEMSGWKFDWDVDDILSCMQACTERPDLQTELDWDKDSLLDRLTLRWCIEVKVALKQLQGVDQCKVLQYESLARGEGWDEVALFLRDRGCRGVPEQQLLLQHSKTGSKKVSKARLTPDQIIRIHKMVEMFGLSRWIV